VSTVHVFLQEHTQKTYEHEYSIKCFSGQESNGEINWATLKPMDVAAEETIRAKIYKK
jgi:hypothetical protein